MCLDTLEMECYVVVLVLVNRNNARLSETLVNLVSINLTK